MVKWNLQKCKGSKALIMNTGNLQNKVSLHKEAITIAQACVKVGKSHFHTFPCPSFPSCFSLCACHVAVVPYTVYFLLSPLPSCPPPSRESRCRSIGQRVKERDVTITDLSQQLETSTATCKDLQESLVQVCCYS